MKTKLKNIREKLVASYWFVPALMCIVAVAAAFGALRYDRWAGEGDFQPGRGWVSVTTADGARELLSTIAGSTITLAGVIFSITVLTLSFASSHYGPRLLRNFMRDRPSQMVLGTFVSTYLYCLFILRTIGEENDTLIPHTSIAGALVLGVGSMAVLIFFVHHVARSIEVSFIIHGVGQDLDVLIETFVKRANDSRHTSGSCAEESEGSPYRITGDREGYVQAISLENLVEVAASQEGLVRLHVAAGDYVSPGVHLATLRTKDHSADSRALEAIRAAVVVGVQRTNEQDIEFPIDQLAEIAVRALSPGVNDPFTAIQCINRLGGGLARLAKTRWPAPVVCDPNDGAPRVCQLPIAMGRLLDRAFNQILHYGGDNPVITRQVMKMLAQAAVEARPVHHDAIIDFATELITRSNMRGVCRELPEIRSIYREMRRS